MLRQMFTCSSCEVSPRQDEALKVLCDGLSKSAEDKIREQLDKANAAYDSVTNNGTTGADGKSAATEKNQNDAASEAVKNEKKDFEESKK